MSEVIGEYYDRLEVRDVDRRRTELFTALPGLIRHAQENAPTLAVHLGDIDPDTVTTPAALADLPVLRKSDLARIQAKEMPFGGLAATPVSRLGRIFASPGLIFALESTRPDYFRLARALFAAGFRPGDVIHNSFSYHLRATGAMIEGGARALGCPVVPAGTADPALQAEVMAALAPRGYAGTPSFLATLLREAADAGLTLHLRRALVSREELTRDMREELLRRHGIQAFQAYATTELGLIAYETKAHDGLVIDESVLVELVEPGTGRPLAPGEVGEVVVTSFNPDYPLIRFATGDLSRLLPGTSACGRTNARLAGWMGHADLPAQA
ncbi:phenylacetate--CoA ligase family protein [Marinivivus vitaminiproducens]|uniref:phenylacetate--CoA ligase family protein n=1 Tax=Marinivivus vitaminiproducens TaxID=3035935 RepID=UPI002797F3F7|nr:AMP-binding protein [Geminicoccaceae bacterium SCSIO 64248]